MNLELQDKVAVVTGASKGIGLATVKALAREGVRVVAGARGTTNELDALARSYDVTPVCVDLATEEGPATLVERAVLAHGALDVLVNNVGASRPRLGGFLTTPDEDWTWTMDVNLMSTVRTTRAALPYLLEREAATIVNVSSVNAAMPHPTLTPYCAAKAALTNLSKALANEFGPQGVRVNTISPGPVTTDMWTGPGAFATQIAEANGTDVDAVMAAFPEQFGLTTGRFATPEEVATLIVLLASGVTASIAGSDYVIDGGGRPTT
jgi:NAD(P)-dependent dehydrogenase (short-subunit alcohol dehydrogenase family)